MGIEEPNWEEIIKIKKPTDNKCAHAGCWSEGEMVGFARCMVEKVKPLESKLFHANRIRIEDAASAINEANELRSEISLLKIDRWISVVDRMPEPETKVLTCTTYGGGSKEIGISFTTKRFPNVFDSFLGDRITHWMPLPEPPKP